jgi:hypothetical protein
MFHKRRFRWVNEGLILKLPSLTLIDRHCLSPTQVRDRIRLFEKKLELEKAIRSSKFKRSFSRRRDNGGDLNLQEAVLNLQQTGLKLAANRFETYSKQV